MNSIISILNQTKTVFFEAWFLIIPIVIAFITLRFFSGDERAKSHAILAFAGFVFYIFFITFILPELQKNTGN